MILHESKVLASICRDSFYEFLVEFWDVIVHEEPKLNWHVKVLCDELQDVAERVFAGKPKDHDLVINVPPGSTKSTICSQMFPAWCWTKMPSCKFIGGSYAMPVAMKDSVRTRDIVLSDKYQSAFPGIILREDENMKGLFVNTQTGFRLSVGVGGMLTGYHGHFLIIDDPLNPEQAYSEQELRTVNRWMETTLPNRKVDKLVSVTILVQQRLHQGDPSGEMLARSTEEECRHICLPGELTDAVSPPTLAKNYQDGLLDPIRMPKPVLDGLRKIMGEYGYAAQVLQDPVPLGGGMFKADMLIMEENAPKIWIRICRSWDKAGTKDGGAYSVGVLMAIDAKGDIWILDVVRGQWGSTEREAHIRQTANVDGKKVMILLELEGGSGGKESGENTVRNLKGFRVLLLRPTGEKEARAYAFSSQVGGGVVHILNREWTREYIEEMRYFPHSKYKDQIDASSQAFNWLANRPRKIGGF